MDAYGYVWLKVQTLSVPFLAFKMKSAIVSEGSETRSHHACMEWARRVHEVQSKRNPREWEAAKQRIESAREHERQSRKCKAVKNHAIRSRALAAEGLRQMSAAPVSEHMAVQTRWMSAQESSAKYASARWDAFSRAPAAAEPQVLVDESDDEAMAEAADLMGAGDATALTALGNDGLQEDGRGGGGGGQSIEELLAQLRTEPADEEECAAKFMLYEGYAREVEEMRNTLLKFNDETRPTLPPTVAADLGNQIGKIDSTEAMGIPDDVREWFVFHMMKKAERNNVSMARILDSFEKKLAFLAKNNQEECPVCLDKFESGDKAPETLGCCHKVCKECWQSWSQVMGGRPFCPLCRHDEFLGAVASRLSEAEGWVSVHKWPDPTFEGCTVDRPQTPCYFGAGERITAWGKRVGTFFGIIMTAPSLFTSACLDDQLPCGWTVGSGVEALGGNVVRAIAHAKVRGMEI